MGPRQEDQPSGPAQPCLCVTPVSRERQPAGIAVPCCAWRLDTRLDEEDGPCVALRHLEMSCDDLPVLNDTLQHSGSIAVVYCTTRKTAAIGYVLSQCQQV